MACSPPAMLSCGSCRANTHPAPPSRLSEIESIAGVSLGTSRRRSGLRLRLRRRPRLRPRRRQHLRFSAAVACVFVDDNGCAQPPQPDPRRSERESGDDDTSAIERSARIETSADAADPADRARIAQRGRRSVRPSSRRASVDEVHGALFARNAIRARHEISCNTISPSSTRAPQPSAFFISLAIASANLAPTPLTIVTVLPP